MAKLITLLLVAAMVTAQYPTDLLEAEFNEFKLTYKRVYGSNAEELQRKKIFAANMLKARWLQSSNPHATFGATQFSDLTSEEFASYHGSAKYYARHAAQTHRVVDGPFPEAATKIDWRTKGAVTPVKNQGQCGSCWAFSATGNIEGQWFLAGHKLVSVSEQELVSCDTIDSGCNGGLMDNAFTWLVQKRQGQIDSENTYPYQSGSGVAPKCNLNGRTVAATIKGHQDIAHNENTMAEFVAAKGPLSVGVDATSWQSYKQGVITNCVSQQVDHGVLIVGYDDTHNPPYWIVKNSWSATWGENGYVRIKKGNNECLISDFPSTSVV